MATTEKPRLNFTDDILKRSLEISGIFTLDSRQSYAILLMIIISLLFWYTTAGPVDLDSIVSEHTVTVSSLTLMYPRFCSKLGLTEKDLSATQHRSDIWTIRLMEQIYDEAMGECCKYVAPERRRKRCGLFLVRFHTLYWCYVLLFHVAAHTFREQWMPSHL